MNEELFKHQVYQRYLGIKSDFVVHWALSAYLNSVILSSDSIEEAKESVSEQLNVFASFVGQNIDESDESNQENPSRKLSKILLGEDPIDIERRAYSEAFKQFHETLLDLLEEKWKVLKE